MEIVDSVAARGVLMSAAPFIAKGTEPIGPTACILSPARVMGPLVCHEHGTGLFRL